jgi:hypothetical protein
VGSDREFREIRESGKLLKFLNLFKLLKFLNELLWVIMGTLPEGLTEYI